MTIEKNYDPFPEHREELDEYDFYIYKQEQETQAERLTYDAQKVMIMRDVFFNQDDFVFVFPEIREIRDIRFYN